MELFEEIIDANKNWLPYDGCVLYFGKVLNETQASTYYEKLLNDIDWRADEAVIFGQRIFTKRKVAWYGDTEFEYTYSKTTKKALVWTKELLELKKLVEKTTGETYNSCLLNLYHDGSEGMAWHSDSETALKKQGAIASLTLGAERKFSFKHKTTKEKVDLVLKHGSLLVIKGTTQDYWLHRLPPTTKVKTPRINLTFRTIV